MKWLHRLFAPAARLRPSTPRLIAGLLIASALSLAALGRGTAAGRDEPREKAPPAVARVKVTLDIREAPELNDWALKVKKLVEHWYPIVSELLHSDDAGMRVLKLEPRREAHGRYHQPYRGGGRKIATAVNGRFVAAAARPATPLTDGDKIEVVAPMQGG